MTEYVSAYASDDLVRAEKAYLEPSRRKRRGITAPDANLPWSGIALSGGGIRAATFSLGVLQALAASNLLKQFDYISSVSGGGYIASSLQWWWSKARYNDDPIFVNQKKVAFGLGPDDFPYGAPGASADTSPYKQVQVKNLAYLRSHGYYLTPGGGINFWSALSVVLRTILLSLLVWIPLIVLIFIIIQSIDEFVLQNVTSTVLGWAGPRFDNLQSPLFGLMINYWSCSNAQLPPDYLIKCAFGMRLFFSFILWGFLLAIGIFVFISICFALLSRTTQDIPETRKRVVRAVGSAIMAAVLLYWATGAYYSYSDKQLPLVVLIIIAGALGIVLVGRAFVELFRYRAINGSYFLRRTLERSFGLLFVPILVVLLIGLTPVLPYFLIQQAIAKSAPVLTAGSIITGAFSVIGGALSALYGYYTRVNKILPGLTGRILAPVGSTLYLYGTLLIGYVLAVFTFQALAHPSSFSFPWTAHNPHVVVYVQVLGLVAILAALILGATASINHIGLHRFYRDRLMEAFMPASDAITRGRADYSPVADRLQLSDVLPQGMASCADAEEATPAVPFPIINALAILTRDIDRRLTARGGDNFILTPLFLGSTATGWANTTNYIGRFGPMTLASAMAGSGAAVNSNAGYLGQGSTRNQLVSMAMTILNMRLGLWIANPAKRNRLAIPTYFHPMLTAGLLGLGYTTKSPFIELADGGDFENLGLYELVRRKLNLIVVVDAEADSTIALSALVSASHRVNEDFAAVISFVTDRGPERFVPITVSGAAATYPAGISYASAPFLVGEIKYNDGTAGTLIYIKATLIKNLAFTTSGYRARNVDFPHQTTIDQFFDPDQFEAYRDLGFCSAKAMIATLNLNKLIHAPNEILAQYAKP